MSRPRGWVSQPGLAWPMQVPSGTGSSTHREFKLIILIAGQEGPPALDALLFKDGDQGHVHLPGGHLHGALLGCLSAPREPVQVQFDGPCTNGQSQFQSPGRDCPAAFLSDPTQFCSSPFLALYF